MSPLPAPLETAFLALTNPDCLWQRLRYGLSLRVMTRIRAWRRAGYLNGVTHLLDAGANEGAFALAWAAVAPSTVSFCFEPVPETFRTLQQRCRSRPTITAVPLGLGSSVAKIRMNTGEFHEANSLLPMTEAHLKHWPASAATKSIEIELTTLDEFVAKHQISGRFFLKADVQGYEIELLKGASRTLPNIPLIQVEISLVPLYQGAPDLPEVWKYLDSLGYRFLEVADVLISPTDRTPVSCDLLFGRVPSS